MVNIRLLDRINAAYSLLTGLLRLNIHNHKEIQLSLVVNQRMANLEALRGTRIDFYAFGGTLSSSEWHHPNYFFLCSLVRTGEALPSLPSPKQRLRSQVKAAARE